MRKTNLPCFEPDIEICSEFSENVVENLRFARKLKLQRIVLNMLICSDSGLSIKSNTNDPNPSDPISSIINQNPQS